MAQPWVPAPGVVSPRHMDGREWSCYEKQTPPMAQPWVPAPVVLAPGHMGGVGERQLWSWPPHGTTMGSHPSWNIWVNSPWMEKVFFLVIDKGDCWTAGSSEALIH